MAYHKELSGTDKLEISDGVELLEGVFGFENVPKLETVILPDSVTLENFDNNSFWKAGNVNPITLMVPAELVTDLQGIVGENVIVTAK